MTLATELLDAGWHEVEAADGRLAAERFASRPGASSSIIRVEADSQDGLAEAVERRERELSGTTEEIKDTITNDGTLVTASQHEAVRTEGVTVVGAPQIAQPVFNEDQAKQVAFLETGSDPTEGVVNAPQVPADAADQPAPADAGSSETPESQSTPSPKRKAAKKKKSAAKKAPAKRKSASKPKE